MLSLDKILVDTIKPSPALLNDVEKHLDGDTIILGVSGKMGKNLAYLLKNAISEKKLPYKVYGAARFTNPKFQQELEAVGIETIKIDFLDDGEIRRLPKVKNVIFMVGYKFGTNGNEPYTWAINAYLPGRICEYYKEAKIVAFSTGCVYPLVPISQAAPSEEFSPNPIGEYAQSCLGRERMFQHFSIVNRTPVTIYRLNYAIDLKYGILSELGQSILKEEPIDVSMGQVNIIWQKDACEYAIRSLFIATSPANIVNVTGPETLSVRWLAKRLGEELDKDVKFVGEEKDTALLSNASKAHELFGYPQVTVREMIKITADWLIQDGELSDKPTHFQEREGKY